MHESSYAKMRCFLDVYGGAGETGGLRTVLEVGSKSYGGQGTYRKLFDEATYRYTGLDVEAGENVDIVPESSFVWREIPDDSFDLVISGQTFEHNPCFWVTFCEIARVLRPGGHACVIAPGAGTVHRFPLDCWRFYPDSWAALCGLSGLTLVENWYEPDRLADTAPGGGWRDCAVIARKVLADGQEADGFNARLRDLSAPYVGVDVGTPAAQRVGPAFGAYAGAMRDAHPPSLATRLRRRWKFIRRTPRIWSGDPD